MLALCGCPPRCPETKPSQYTLVEYRVGSELGRAPQVEISKTASYEALRSRLSSAAIRLPDSCLSQVASQVTGVSRQGQTILLTECGVWLAEIERALARVGFRVVSWDALRQRESQRKISTYEAAKELGAGVVFVFNSLETGDIKAGSKVGTSFKYFVSDERGQRGPPRPLDEKARARMRGYVQSVVGSTAPDRVVGLSATLDCTAVNTDSGEALWFYRRTVTLPIETAGGVRFLFGRRDDVDWTPARPLLPKAAASAPAANLASEDVSAREVATEANDPFAAYRLQLVREGASDLVQNFRAPPNK